MQRFQKILVAALLLTTAHAFQTTPPPPPPPSGRAAINVKRRFRYGSRSFSTVLSAAQQQDSYDEDDRAVVALLEEEQDQQRDAQEPPQRRDYEVESVMDLSMDWIEGVRSDSAVPPEPQGAGDAASGLLWRGVVLVLCALWASNFAAIKLVVAEPGVNSSLFAVSRFGVAALALTPFALSSVRRSGMDGETLRGAIACGSWVAFGYLGQLIGLLTTTASRSCVICSLHCVFVAGIAEFMRSSKSASGQFDVKVLAPAALAVVGVSIVELWGAGGAPTVGDLLSFAQPIGFGMGYLKLEELMSRRPDTALPVSAIKLTIVALASLFYFEVGPLLDFSSAAAAGASEWALRLPDFSAILASPTALAGVFYTGLATTAVALWVESIAFARVPATDASIILTTEPLFAALFGAISLGETFGTSDYVGASLIIGGCVLATLMETPGDEECIISDDENPCEPPRKWPFWGF